MLPPASLPSNVVADVLKLRVAVQLAPFRWRRAIEQICTDLESGQSWQTAIGRAREVNGELADIAGAGLAAGHPADITLGLLRHRALGRVAWRELVAAVLYPSIILSLALIIGSLTALAMMTSMVGFAREQWPMTESASVRAHDYYDASMGGLLSIGWLIVLGVSAHVVATPSSWLKIVGSLPLVGRPYRWLGLSEFLMRLSVFAKYQPSLLEAIHSTARSFGAGALAPVATYVADRVAEGEPFEGALHSTIVSDSRAGIALAVIEPVNLSQSLQRAGELLNEMIAYTCRRIRMLYSLVALLVIISTIWGAWATYLDMFASIYRSITMF